MDNELKQYLEAMETRMESRLQAMEARMGGRLEAMETRLEARFATKEDLERVETSLLTEFHKWASPADMRAKSHALAIRAMDAELESPTERVQKLEGNQASYRLSKPAARAADSTFRRARNLSGSSSRIRFLGA